MPSHERLRERLARFEPSRRLARTEEESSCACKSIGDAEAQGQLGAHDCEVDLFAQGQVQRAVRIGKIHGGRPPDRCDARIARRADDLGGLPAGRKPDSQRVLARTAAENKNSHDLKGLSRIEVMDARGAAGDYFIDLGLGLRLESAFTVEQTPEYLVPLMKMCLFY